MKEDSSTYAEEPAAGQTRGTTFPRLAILGCLMVVLFFPLLALYLVVTRSSMDGPFGLFAMVLWLGSTGTLLILGGAQVKTEPDLIQGCLRLIALVILLSILMLFGLT